ncbi:hypothetical protein PBI_LAMBO_83 [Gordonia phage Lambo]|uniref:Uncharacterized protein n=2 Tax=Lambovirus TaxID=2843412 RepID=A0A5J6TUP4_9CAUD|nr:hypothetical protein HWC70_gp83 [Gordonia phage Lambo]QFG13589.1 hypothetical protein PBI_LAMBO_83 [Gordonia phage Lambo]UJQ86151.1 hypothetical protein ZANY_82 [Gordonia phage Zany]
MSEPTTRAEYRDKYPDINTGDLCPECEDPDSRLAIIGGVCFICICGCPRCEGQPDAQPDWVSPDGKYEGYIVQPKIDHSEPQHNGPHVHFAFKEAQDED